MVHEKSACVKTLLEESSPWGEKAAQEKRIGKLTRRPAEQFTVRDKTVAN